MIRGLGIDLGSTTVKVAGVDETGECVYDAIAPTEARMEAQAERMLAAVGETVPVVATGYGRALVREAKAVTEITCHAKGVFHVVGHGGSLIDLGGQDTKVILVGDGGKVRHFVMNDRCAAGTGRFLEVVAARLGVPLTDLAGLALAGTAEATISSTCTVFAESEIISLLARGEPLESLSRGLHRSLVRRVVALARSAAVKAPFLLSGGGALNPAVHDLLEEELGSRVFVPRGPQHMGAHGAALLAAGL